MPAVVAVVVGPVRVGLVEGLMAAEPVVVAGRKQVEPLWAAVVPELMVEAGITVVVVAAAGTMADMAHPGTVVAVVAVRVMCPV